MSGLSFLLSGCIYYPTPILPSILYCLILYCLPSFQVSSLSSCPLIVLHLHVLTLAVSSLSARYNNGMAEDRTSIEEANGEMTAMMVAEGDVPSRVMPHTGGKKAQRRVGGSAH